MKRFDGGSLIPGATWHATAETEAEVVSKAIDRLKAEHGETQIRPDMVERIKERIFDIQTRH
ncbi:DUF1059 domain-containing protein [Pelagibacterium lacus]|uniref:DUF1059 domain-containing protein n=1 Tax=Pelagibacterium lacus TaxID=2282655 RepID=A0A369W4D8_9HYPH|nr:DUF1059 domain-containing protein [Pelagibacterium lacus]RDE08735.1 DUF1059 domain-containing protein [Pelagibacterium lacus]